MTAITLTRFNVTKKAYNYQDSYIACLDPQTDGNCHGIKTYMDGLLRQMSTFKNEPTAWSFSNWKRGNNTKENWLSATAIAIEYRLTPANRDLPLKLHERAVELGYAFLLLDTYSRSGADTLTIIFPLSEPINHTQYARLTHVLMEELGFYRAATGNLAATHLVHVGPRCSCERYEGVVLNPRAKIKETEKLYQSLDGRRFEAAASVAGLHVSAPVLTHDGLFEWSEADADALILKVDAQLGAGSELR